MFTTDTVPQNSDELKWYLSQKIEEVDRRQQECKAVRYKMDDLEEEFQWQNKQRKDLNDYLLEMNSKSKDGRLQELLLEQEDMLYQESIQEEIMFSECRDELDAAFTEMEKQKDEYYEQIRQADIEERTKYEG